MFLILPATSASPDTVGGLSRLSEEAITVDLSVCK
jgi:hypothetical protein